MKEKLETSTKIVLFQQNIVEHTGITLRCTTHVNREIINIIFCILMAQYCSCSYSENFAQHT
jgi:hypothetical protein